MRHHGGFPAVYFPTARRLIECAGPFVYWFEDTAFSRREEGSTPSRATIREAGM